MSCFIVSNKTMNNIIHLVHKHGLAAVPDKFRGMSTRGTLEILAKELFRLNTLAYNNRYGEKVEAPKFELIGTGVPNIQGYKSLRCLYYQCNEMDVPLELIENLLNTVAHSILTSLREYGRAGWDEE